MSHSAAPLSAGLRCWWTVLRHHQLVSPYDLRDDAKMNKKDGYSYILRHIFVPVDTRAHSL